MLGVAVYQLNISINDTSGNSNSTIINITINPITPTISLTLNGTGGNITIVNNSRIDLNCSTTDGDATAILNLYNETNNLINSAISPIGNTTNFNSTGIFNITCIYIYNYFTISISS